MTNGQPHQIDSWGPKFPPQNFDIPDINVISNSNFSEHLTNNFYSKPPGGALYNNTANQQLVNSQAHQTNVSQSQAPSQVRLNQSQPTTQLGLRVTSPQNNNHNMDNRQTSPSGSNNTSPGRESSEESSDDSLPLSQVGRNLHPGTNLVSIRQYTYAI